MATPKKNNKTINIKATTPITVLQTPDLTEAELKGNVWQVKQNFYRATLKKNGVIQCKLNGKVYLKDNVIITFNTDGVKTSLFSYGVVGSIHKEKFENGKSTEFISYDNDGKVTTTFRTNYSKQGNLKERIMLDKDDKLKQTDFWTFDENGGMTEYYNILADGTCSDKHIMVNDKMGKPIESKVLGTDGSLKHWSRYTNNEHGHSIEKKEMNLDGTVKKVETHTYEYNAAGVVIGCDGKLFSKDKSEMETYKYEYDEQGNWIRKYEFFREIPTGIHIREINYYGDGKKELTMKTTKIKNIFILESTGQNIGDISEEEEGKDDYENYSDDDDEAEENKLENILTPAQIQWVMEASSPENFSAYRCYGAMFNEIPTEVTIDNDIVEVMALMAELKENMGACLINCKDDIWGYDDHPRYSSYTLAFPDKPYILHVKGIDQEDVSDYDVPSIIEDRIDNSYQIIFTGLITLFHPSDASGKRDMEWEKEFDYHLQTCMIQQKPEMPEIYMIQVSNGNFSLKSHPVNDNFLIKDLDLNYGYGFEKFHNELMERFKNGTKGLVLFHGQPGTGKTFYIRHLLRKMASNNKKVIYMPPNMVDHLTDPTFLTFLSLQVGHFSTNNNFCVLLIEDAEPLLAKRQEGVRIQGVTNLLNMTDGLLNDMLNLQIICTFNVDLKKLDSALLRPGRLIARKEFKALAVLDANLLAQRLGIKHHFKKPASLGEIYSLLKNQNTLIHDVEPERDASTPIDDL